MSEFSKDYNGWHQKNDGCYSSATEYHKALKKHFRDWKSLSFQKDTNKKITALKRENQRLNAENMAIKVLLDNAKQPKKPVVPECVADWIEEVKSNGESLFSVFADANQSDSFLRDMPFDVYMWIGGENNNDEILARAWLDGYTVEPEKKFYLKNIDLSEHDEKCDWFLTKKDIRLSNDWIEKGRTPQKIYGDDPRYQFTQSEIDKLHGGYEKVEAQK